MLKPFTSIANRSPRLTSEPSGTGVKTGEDDVTDGLAATTPGFTLTEVGGVTSSVFSGAAVTDSSMAVASEFVSPSAINGVAMQKFAANNRIAFFESLFILNSGSEISLLLIHTESFLDRFTPRRS